MPANRGSPPRSPSTALRPKTPTSRGSRAAVLGIYAERDDRVNASRDIAAAALERARLTHEIKTFAGAQHAFFNPSSSRHDPEAAREARSDMLAWFDRHL
jgi:carboxymethylenebutenolidase